MRSGWFGRRLQVVRAPSGNEYSVIVHRRWLGRGPYLANQAPIIGLMYLLSMAAALAPRFRPWVVSVSGPRRTYRLGRVRWRERHRSHDEAQLRMEEAARAAAVGRLPKPAPDGDR